MLAVHSTAADLINFDKKKGMRYAKGHELLAAELTIDTSHVSAFAQAPWVEVRYSMANFRNDTFPVCGERINLNDSIGTEFARWLATEQPASLIFERVDSVKFNLFKLVGYSAKEWYFYNKPKFLPNNPVKLIDFSKKENFEPFARQQLLAGTVTMALCSKHMYIGKKFLFLSGPQTNFGKFEGLFSARAELNTPLTAAMVDWILENKTLQLVVERTNPRRDIYTIIGYTNDKNLFKNQ